MSSPCCLSRARRRQLRSGERRRRPPLRHARPEPEQPGLLQLAPPLQREHHLAVLLRLHLHRRQGEDGGHHVGRRLQRVSLPAQMESQGEVYLKEYPVTEFFVSSNQTYVSGLELGKLVTSEVSRKRFLIFFEHILRKCLCPLPVLYAFSAYTFSWRWRTKTLPYHMNNLRVAIR